jgi:outer membrane protein OmpA-like peptidoglycan-associated protein
VKVNTRLLAITVSVIAIILVNAAAIGQTRSGYQSGKTPESLVVHFNVGSAAIRPQDESLLDRASRLYRDGHPVVMIITGSTDTVGSPGQNLALSEKRANAVLDGLVARGIPESHFQIVAKGETELAVQTPSGVPQPENRRAEITWH